MRIKKDDKVKVISGEYKGVEGHVLKSFRENNKLIVEKEMEAPIHVSNVQFVCPKCGKPSKVKMKILDDKSRIRYCTKCGDMV
jgi:large subunit ribosomal protein L24